jgi:hypothetical protein
VHVESESTESESHSAKLKGSSTTHCQSMKYLLHGLIALPILAFAASPSRGQPPADVKAALEEKLKDPESARYSDVFIVQSSEGTSAACGWVNAKNSHGGYVGKTRFVVIRMEPKPGKFISIVQGIETDDDRNGSMNLFDQMFWAKNCKKP